MPDLILKNHAPDANGLVHRIPIHPAVRTSHVAKPALAGEGRWREA